MDSSFLGVLSLSCGLSMEGPYCFLSRPQRQSGHQWVVAGHWLLGTGLGARDATRRLGDPLCRANFMFQEGTGSN